MEKIILTAGMAQASTFDAKEAENIKAKKFNEASGTLMFYNCEKCNNKGIYAYINTAGNFETKVCECMRIRKARERLSESGLLNMAERYTFDNFTATETWQKSIVDAAKSYINNTCGNWFFIGGQVGSGKSHICTAIANELIYNGNDVHYMLWRDDAVPLKANVNNFAEYERRIKPLKTVPVLYIDDFLKTEKGKAPTPADINIAFEVLNYRYNDPALTTIISTELLIRDIITIDEAVGSRIYERSKKYQININPDINKNYRLR